MDPAAFATSPPPLTSRLRIHAGCEGLAADWSLAKLLRQMRLLYPDGGRSEQPRLDLEIRDLQGQRVLALEDAVLAVDLALPPGTYHVDTVLAGTRRQYTVALTQGACVDLHLRQGPDRR